MTMSERTHVDVAGCCPMGCGATLVVGDGGHIVCSSVACSNPTAVDELLAAAVGHECPQLAEAHREMAALAVQLDAALRDLAAVRAQADAWARDEAGRLADARVARGLHLRPRGEATSGFTYVEPQPQLLRALEVDAP